jgi:hypothetical protein
LIRRFISSLSDVSPQRKIAGQYLPWSLRGLSAIIGRRVFVPVNSQDYFETKMCRFEIKKLFIRRDGTGDEQLLYPLARPRSSVPYAFNHVQFQDAAKEPECIDDLLAPILGRAHDTHWQWPLEFFGCLLELCP